MSSSEAICEMPSPRWTAVSAVSRSETSTTSAAGTTATSGASTERNTQTSSTITNAIDTHCTLLPLEVPTALLSARVAI